MPSEDTKGPPADAVPAAAVLRRRDFSATKRPETPATTPEGELPELDVREDVKVRPAKRRTRVIPAEQRIPTQRARGRRSPAQGEPQEASKSAQSQGRFEEERLVVENVVRKERVERIFDQDVPISAELGEQNALTPLVMQQPPGPVVKPVFDPCKNPYYHEAPTKMEPTIQVSIGRVEVRATRAPSQKRATAKGPPPMSLEDYLRRRDGGG